MTARDPRRVGRIAAALALLLGSAAACSGERSFITVTPSEPITAAEALPTAVPHVTPSELTKTWQYGTIRSFYVDGGRYALELDRGYYCTGAPEDEKACGTRPTSVPTGPWVVDNNDRTVTLTVSVRALIQLWGSSARTWRQSHWLPDAYDPGHQRLRSEVHGPGKPMPAFLYADSTGDIVRIKED